MELRNLRTFLRAAALKSFTAAGKELGYSQANISAQIKQLETEVGVPLFDRIGRSVALTQYGEALLPYARSIVSTAVKMESLLRSEADLGGVLRIGMVESLFDAMAPELLPAYHRKYPQVRMELSVDATATLKEALSKDALDLACLIDYPLPPSQWQVLTAAETKAVAVVNPSHPLAGRGEVTVAELAGQELIFMEHAAPYGQQVSQALAGMGVEPAPFLTLQSPAMAGRLLEAGPYLSILPLYTVAQAVEAGRLTMLNVRGMDLRQTIQVVLHRDKAPLPQLTGFAELAGTMMRSLPGAIPREQSGGTDA